MWSQEWDQMGFFGNSPIFQATYLRAQEELGARETCARKPHTWSLRRINNFENIFSQKKLQLDKYAHKTENPPAPPQQDISIYKKWSVFLVLKTVQSPKTLK